MSALGPGSCSPQQPVEQVASGHAEPGQHGHQSDGFVAQEPGVTPLSLGSPATQQPQSPRR